MNVASLPRCPPPLPELLRGLAPEATVAALPELAVTGVTLDSRAVAPGSLFIARRGLRQDGRGFIDGAIARGAAAVLAEADDRWQGVGYRGAVPVVAVAAAGAAASEIAGRFHRHPSEALALFGITGTNGKSSCASFIAATLGQLGYSCGLIGTLGRGLPGRLAASPLTTPDAAVLQAALADLRRDGVAAVALEVSSIGLDQQRVAALRFHTAVFTNLSRDHLDYHRDMTAYADCKLRLFASPGLRHAVINLDDPYAARFLARAGSQVVAHTYSERDPTAAVFADAVECLPDGLRCQLRSRHGHGTVSSRLLGRFNVGNLLAAAAAVSAYLDERGQEVDWERLCAVLSALEPVPGRLEVVGAADGVTAVVDYAHTPAALGSALAALKDHFAGRICCVVGCGGDRDAGKRPLMGEIAESLADRLILTDDNPRWEDGAAIIAAMKEGMACAAAATVIRNRAAAIDEAIGAARPGDVVLIAGKGHETCQEVRGRRLPFHDGEQARRALARRRGSGR